MRDYTIKNAIEDELNDSHPEEEVQRDFKSYEFVSDSLSKFLKYGWVPMEFRKRKLSTIDPIRIDVSL